ncbi:MAG: hypothetical protein HYS07_08680 [Chlamydiae bacterium]|nr:hypothetical protein [Chlamydiota bacterium]MBI3277872.1 hypothetical protein [Chlamydiota bacterium]
MLEENKKDKDDGADEILKKVGKVIPGFDSFFQKAQNSKIFGGRIKQIREEINRRFGKKDT